MRNGSLWRGRIILVVGIGAFTLVVCISSGLFSRPWFKRSSVAPAVAETLAARPAAGNATTEARPLQGPTGIVPPPPSGNDSSISKVPLPLILTATRPGRNAREGYADIGVDAKSPQTYIAGAMLANGTRLAEIYADSVLLQKDQRSVRLYIQSAANSQRTVAKDLTAMLTVSGIEPPPLAVADSREELTDYIVPAPVYEGSAVRGYQVYAGRASQVFRQWGLEPGDVITAIDGAPLSDPQSAIDRLESLTQGAALTVTVDRKGQSSTIALDGALIVASMERSRNPPTQAMTNQPLPSM